MEGKEEKDDEQEERLKKEEEERLKREEEERLKREEEERLKREEERLKREEEEILKREEEEERKRQEEEKEREEESLDYTYNDENEFLQDALANELRMSSTSRDLLRVFKDTLDMNSKSHIRITDEEEDSDPDLVRY